MTREQRIAEMRQRLADFRAFAGEFKDHSPRTDKIIVSASDLAWLLDCLEEAGRDAAEAASVIAALRKTLPQSTVRLEVARAYEVLGNYDERRRSRSLPPSQDPREVTTNG